MNKSDNTAPAIFTNTFTFPVTGATVRTIVKEGEPWFVAKDVAVALGYSDTDKAARMHCKKVNDSNPDKTAGIPSPKIIPESDVYRLVMRSKLPQAEAFQDWVCEEVLPTIRKHGAYIDKQRVDPSFLRQIADEIETLSNQLEEVKPAVALCNTLTNGRTRWRITIAAKEIGAPLGSLQLACIKHRVLEPVELSDGSTRYMPSYTALEKGLCAMTSTYDYYFTPRGIEWLEAYATCPLN